MLVIISRTVTSITAFSVTKKLQKSRKKAELSWGNTSCCSDWCQRNDRLAVQVESYCHHHMEGWQRLSDELCCARSRQRCVGWNCLQTCRLPKQDQDPRHHSRNPDTSWATAPPPPATCPSESGSSFQIQPAQTSSSSLHHLYTPPCPCKFVTLLRPFMQYFNCI